MRFNRAIVASALVAFAYTASPSAQTPTTGNIVAGEILVKFRPGANDVAKANTHRASGGTQLNEIARTGLQRVRVTPGTERAAVARYRGNQNVLYAEPNFVRSIPTPTSHAPGTEFLPGDHYFNEQWALHNTGQLFYCFPWIEGDLCFYIGTPDADIDAPEAWAVSLGGSVRVAVIDSGIDYTHPDLAANYIGGYDYVSGDSDPMDDHGHGTHVSGTIAAAVNNLTGDPAAEEGVAGVAPNAQILAYKVCRSDGTCSDFAIAQAIAQAVADSAKVINMSLGGPEYSQAMYDAVQDAWNAGAVIVAGAGNDGTTAEFYPAAFPNVISVAAFDEDHRRAPFSNYGSWVDISAPGNVIMSSYPLWQCTAAGVPGDTGCYTWLSGTSMATPHVAGAAALIWSRGGVTTNSQVVDILLGSADPLGTAIEPLNSWTIHGGLNLHDAMSFGLTNLPPVANAGPDRTIVDTDGDGQELVTLDGGASSDADGTIASYEWREGQSVASLVATAEVWLSVGTHTLTLTVVDNDGATATDSVVVTVSPAPNVPPVANAGLDQTVTDIDRNGTELVTLNGSASSDSDGTIVSYEWREGAGLIATGATTTAALSVGTHTLTLRVTDDDGASASDTVVVVVNPPPPPTSVHVGDLEGASDANKSAWTAQITVTVHDANHQSVSDAVVTGTWSGGASGSGTCTTDTGGTCVVVSSGMRKRIATATFTVGGVTVSGHSYNAGQNHDADGDSNGTVMTVAKP
jgi:thermitase